MNGMDSENPSTGMWIWIFMDLYGSMMINQYRKWKPYIFGGLEAEFYEGMGQN